MDRASGVSGSEDPDIAVIPVPGPGRTEAREAYRTAVQCEAITGRKCLRQCSGHTDRPG